MSRKANIKLGKQANAILERHICSFEGSITLLEITDHSNLRVTGRALTDEQMKDNNINMIKGIDYVYVYRDKQGINHYKYIDTKGFNYDPRYYGSIYDNGMPEFLLLQVEKLFINSNTKYYGWSNDPNHKTEYIVILINNIIIWLDYKKLLEFMTPLYDPFEVLTEDLKILNQFIKKPYEMVSIRKHGTEVNKCLKIPTIELFQKGIMTGFYPVETEWLNVV